MKAIASILILITLCTALTGCVEFGDPTISTDASGVQKDDTSSVGSSDNVSSKEEDEGPIFDFDSWQLRLVNPWNSIPEGFGPELALIDKEYAGFANAQFDARAIDALHALCDAAKADGIKLTIISAYRTNEFQTGNFNRKVDRVMAANPSLTREEAEIEAATVVARPGTSEHQVGLAVDFNSVEQSFKNTKTYQWLEAHCTDYGFIIRYTAEKQDKTGIIPEPWHYRYVGVEAAKLMEAEDLCLEEFIEKYNTAN